MTPITTTKSGSDRGEADSWDHSTHPDFYEYYAKESESETTVRRFKGVQGAVLRVAAANRMRETLDVADIGCGAGTQSRLWAERGHRVYGLDVNEPLIELARSRAKQTGLTVEFEVGTATSLPWPNASMDVCLLPELLEHVVEWKACLREAVRVLREGGILYVSTTNVLCPRQQEFELPLYSWYPARVKRYCEHLAITTRPAIANYAKYPAVNWFSFYSLKAFLKPLGLACLDRFDLMDPTGKGKLVNIACFAIRHSRFLRFLAHVAIPGTSLVGVKASRHSILEGGKVEL